MTEKKSGRLTLFNLTRNTHKKKIFWKRGVVKNTANVSPNQVASKGRLKKRMGREEDEQSCGDDDYLRGETGNDEESDDGITMDDCADVVSEDFAIVPGDESVQTGTPEVIPLVSLAVEKRNKQNLPRTPRIQYTTDTSGGLVERETKLIFAPDRALFEWQKTMEARDKTDTSPIEFKCWWCTQKPFLTDSGINTGSPNHRDIFHCVKRHGRKDDGKIYGLEGLFCSPNCAKAHMLAHYGFKHIDAFREWLKIRHGINVSTHIQPSLPRTLLKEYFGPYNLNEYRVRSGILTRQGKCAISYKYSTVEPPYVPLISNIVEVTTTRIPLEVIKRYYQSTVEAEPLSRGDIMNAPTSPPRRRVLGGGKTYSDIDEDEPPIKKTKVEFVSLQKEVGRPSATFANVYRTDKAPAKRGRKPKNPAAEGEAPWQPPPKSARAQYMEGAPKRGLPKPRFRGKKVNVTPKNSLRVHRDVTRGAADDREYSVPLSSGAATRPLHKATELSISQFMNVQ